MKTLGIIPARYASSRFPGKPLADLNGKPLVYHVYLRAKQALQHVVVATDDKRIFEKLAELGAKVIMTSTQHRSGTERCAEALTKYSQMTNINFDFVINIQGDEPLIDPEIILKLKQNLTDSTQIATLVKIETDPNIIFNPNVVKVITDYQDHAIYFSRHPIPFIRDIAKNLWPQNFQYLTHIGIYAYRTDVLQKITKLKPTDLENAEKLEQLRWIYYGYKIKTITVDYQAIGVDTPEDLEFVRKLLLKSNE